MKNKYFLFTLIIMMGISNMTFSQLQSKPSDLSNNDNQALINDNTLLGYNIYKNNQKVNDELLTDLQYSDIVEENGAVNYYVTAVYEEGESGSSNKGNMVVNLDKEDRNYVVMEDFTGTWCQFCPGAAMGMDDLIANGKKVLGLAYHTGDDYQITASLNRTVNFYGIQAFPEVLFDGVSPGLSGSANQSMYSAYLPIYNKNIEVPTVFKMAATGTHSGASYNATVNIEKVNENSSSNLKLLVAVIEDEIEEDWQGLDKLNAVVRKMMPNEMGTAIDFSDGDVQSIDLSFTVSSAWEKNNCSFVFFIQDFSTKTIYQANKISISDFAEEAIKHKSATNETLFAPYDLQTQRSTFSPNITITWKAPGDDRWMFWGNGRNKYKIGSEDETLVFDVASRWSTDDVLPLEGMAITKVDIYLAEATCKYALKLWSGDSDDNLILDSMLTDVNAKQWNTIKLAKPYNVDISKELWVGYYNENTVEENSAGCDAGPAMVGKGDKIRFYKNGTTEEWSNASDMGVNANWNIKLYVEPAKITSINALIKPEIDVFPNPTSGTVTINASEKITCLYIINTNGQVMMKTNPNKNSVNLNTNKLISGVYFIKAVSANGYEFKKLVVK